LDYYWEWLSEGGDPQAQQCGWLKDKFGLSWQVVPKVLPKLLTNPDTKKSQRAFRAMLQMKKLDIAGLQRAFASSSA
jgi:predicted 3-demethylubiquinone-9 3-methyltransferase (glyoxalase superfamily)